MKKAKAQSIHIEKIACIGLFLLCLGLVVLYMYLLSASVIHVVIQKETKQSIVTLNSEVSQLENRYMDAHHQVSAQIASLEGYSEIKEKVFIDRTPSTLVLSSIQP